MGAPLGTTAPNRRWGCIVAIGALAFAVIVALLLPGNMLRGSMHIPLAVTPEQLARVARAQPVDLVVQVQTVQPDGTARALLLRSVTGSQYERTHTAVFIERGTDTKTVMGSARDVEPGAVLQVHATATGRLHDGNPVLAASQIVIITGFAAIQ